MLLHPNKNKTIGDDGTFNLIVEAWGLFSDRVRRKIYDEKIKVLEFNHP